MLSDSPEWADLAPRIERGVALLNRLVPGWVYRVRRHRLYEKDDRSVLEFVFGDYRTGLEALELTYARALDHGFYRVKDLEDWPWLERTCVRKAWREAITKRRRLDRATVPAYYAAEMEEGRAWTGRDNVG